MLTFWKPYKIGDYNNFLGLVIVNFISNNNSDELSLIIIISLVSSIWSIYKENPNSPPWNLDLWQPALILLLIDGSFWEGFNEGSSFYW